MGRTRPIVAVVGISFGWGSAGKIDSICRSLLLQVPDTEFLLLGQLGSGNPISGLPITARTESFPGQYALRALVDRFKVAAAIVVMNPAAARELKAVGCPVIYVDSLPFLWRYSYEFPESPDWYFAQAHPGFSLQTVEHGIPDSVQRPTWTEPIAPTALVPSPKRLRSRSRVLVSFGGMNLPSSVEGFAAYTQALLPVILEGLTGLGYNEVSLCGGIGPPSICGDTSSASCLPDGVVAVGAATHSDFLELMQECDLVLAPPGLTTLIEASYIGVPVVCLPPQNLSQIVNAKHYARLTNDLIVPWPDRIGVDDILEHYAEANELEAVALLRSRIAASPSSIDEEILPRLVATVSRTNLRAESMTRPYGERYAGAEQISKEVSTYLS